MKKYMRTLNEHKKCGYEVGDSCGCPGNKEGAVSWAEPKGDKQFGNACAQEGYYCDCGRYWDHTDGGRKYSNKITVRESQLLKEEVGCGELLGKSCTAVSPVWGFWDGAYEEHTRRDKLGECFCNPGSSPTAGITSGGGGTISLRESELISLIKRTINEAQLLTEAEKCDVETNAGCEGGGTCMPDPGSLGSDPCCHHFAEDGTNQGCKGRIDNTDDLWLRDDYSDYHMMEPCDKGDHCCECQNTGDEYICCLCTGECKDDDKYRWSNSRINEATKRIQLKESELISVIQQIINEKDSDSRKELSVSKSKETSPISSSNTSYSCTDPNWVSLPAGGTQGTPNYNGGKNNYCDRCDANPTFPVIISNNTWQYNPSNGTNYCSCC